MDLNLKGLGALVVGAAGDTGRAVVDLLRAEGARVVAAGRTPEKLAHHFDRKIVGQVTLDLNDADSVRAGVAEAEALLGAIDILINTAAGTVTYGKIWDISRDIMEGEYRLKVAGAAQLCTLVAEGMVRRRTGTIINLIGIATDIVVTQNPAGSAANAALRSFTRILAAELAPSGIRVIGISPGFIAGERLGRFASGDAATQIARTIPIGRIATPQEIADVTVFMASPRASYVTGAIINVDGGSTLR